MAMEKDKLDPLGFFKTWALWDGSKITTFRKASLQQDSWDPTELLSCSVRTKRLLQTTQSRPISRLDA